MAKAKTESGKKSILESMLTYEKRWEKLKEEKDAGPILTKIRAAAEKREGEKVFRTKTGKRCKLHMKRGLCTRDGAARILGVSITEVQRMEKAGKIPFIVDEKTGWHLFEPDEVMALAKVPGAEERAQPYLLIEDPRTKLEIRPDDAFLVFACLREGKKLVDIVAEHKVAPAVVRRFAEEYHAMEGGLLFDADQVARLRRLPFSGVVRFEDSESVLLALERALSPRAVSA